MATENTLHTNATRPGFGVEFRDAEERRRADMGMTTIDAFVGALLAEISKGRGISDHASVRLAEYYLNHELLKGFPVPRMQVSTLDIDFQFAVAVNARASHLLEDPEIQKGIRYRLVDFLAGLPADRDFREYFRGDASLGAKWKDGLADLSRRLEQVLAKPAPDGIELIQKLSVSAHNYFYESAPDDLRLHVSSLLMRPLKRREDHKSMTMVIEERIREIVAVVSEGRAQVAEAPDDFQILVGAKDLEKLNPSLLNRMKITVSPSDRRWVVSEKDGEKIHILGT